MTNKFKEHVLNISEQEIDDPVSDILFKFVVVPGSAAPHRIYFRFRTSSNWRELCFDQSGEFVRASIKGASPPRPLGRLRLVK